MVHLIYCDNVGKKGERVLDKILEGTKTMVVRGAAGRKIPHSRVFVGERLYFMEKGSALITATAIVKNVQNYIKLTDEEITKILEENQGMLNLSEKYQKSVAQVILRWHIQRGVIPIPKSSNKTRIKENLNVFDFEISNEDMKSIYMLNEGNNASITGVPENTTYLKFD